MVKSGYDAITRATGELNVPDGKYMAYGRLLDIQSGQLIFNGGPIDNPVSRCVPRRYSPTSPPT